MRVSSLFLCALARGRCLQVCIFRSVVVLLLGWYLIYNYARNILAMFQKLFRMLSKSVVMCSTIHARLVYGSVHRRKLCHIHSLAMMFIWLFSCWNPNENSFKCFTRCNGYEILVSRWAELSLRAFCHSSHASEAYATNRIQNDMKYYAVRCAA